jgi:enterochelin esterase-like enzyme
MLYRLMNAAAACAILSACTASETQKSAPVQMSGPVSGAPEMNTEPEAQMVPSPSRLNAQLIEIEAFESAHVKPRNITIWLPDGYLPYGGERYPVIYAHDGQNLFQPGYSYGGVEWGLDETAERMMRAGDLPPAIIVGIWNTDKRWHEYAPQKVLERMDLSAGSAWAGEGTPELLGDAYLKFIVEELKPYIDSTYETAPDAQNTMIMGSSMGGLISLYAAAEYPETFGRAAAVSIHWPLAEPQGAIAAGANAAMQAYLSEAKLNPQTQRLWFDNGTETLDQFYPPRAAAMETWFRAQGWSESQAIFKTYEGTEHSETAWAARADDILTFLLTD